MKLNLKFAEKILKAMFVDWVFNYNIDIHDDTEFSFSIEHNEKQYLILEKENENSNKVAIYINTHFEDDKLLGYYYIKDQSNKSFAYKKGQFERKRDFFEIMFSQHLSL